MINPIIMSVLMIIVFGYFLASVIVKFGFTPIFSMAVVSVCFLIIYILTCHIGVKVLPVFAIAFGSISMTCVFESFLNMIYKKL